MDPVDICGADTMPIGPSSNIGGGGGGEGKVSSGAGGKGSSKGGGGGGKAQFEEKLISSPGGGGGGSGRSSASMDVEADGISPTLPIWARWVPAPGGCGSDGSDAPADLKGFTLGLGATTGANFFCGL